jgi:hypothetical protein
MTNSWGYDLGGLTTLPNFLKPLEAAVLEAVNLRGIIVCFSGGNGQIGFPAMMPQPGLSPKLAKSILRASARDVTVGTSNNGQLAGPGYDGATGAGLVDATRLIIAAVAA